jgi:hypothetical protein
MPVVQLSQTWPEYHFDMWEDIGEILFSALPLIQN